MLGNCAISIIVMTLLSASKLRARGIFDLPMISSRAVACATILPQFFFVVWPQLSVLELGNHGGHVLEQSTSNLRKGSECYVSFLPRLGQAAPGLSRGSIMSTSGLSHLVSFSTPASHTVVGREPYSSVPAPAGFPGMRPVCFVEFHPII